MNVVRNWHLEGHRHKDIIRWRIADDVLNGWCHGLKTNEVVGTDNGYVRVENRAFNANKHEEDFNVHIDEENNLVISMEKKTESKEENNKDEKKEGRYLRREFSYTKFQQTMILPDDVDKEKIGAHVENGVLNITLPKFTEAEKEKAKKFIDVK